MEYVWWVKKPSLLLSDTTYLQETENLTSYGDFSFLSLLGAQQEIASELLHQGFMSNEMKEISDMVKGFVTVLLKPP